MRQALVLFFILVLAAAPAGAYAFSLDDMKDAVGGVVDWLKTFFEGSIDLGKALWGFVNWVKDDPNTAFVVIGIIIVLLGSIGIGGPVATLFGGLLVIFGILRDQSFQIGLDKVPAILLIIGAVVIAGAAYRLTRG